VEIYARADGREALAHRALLRSFNPAGSAALGE